MLDKEVSTDDRIIIFGTDDGSRRDLPIISFHPSGAKDHLLNMLYLVIQVRFDLNGPRQIGEKYDSSDSSSEECDECSLIAGCEA